MSLISKTTCYVCGYSRNSVAAKGISFHQIPHASSMQEIRDRWLEFLHLPPTSRWTQDIWKEITLCSRHFEEGMYNPQHDLMIRVVLKKGAAPSLERPVGPGTLGTLFPHKSLQISDKGCPSQSQVVHDVKPQPSEMDKCEGKHLCTNPPVDASVSPPDTLMRGATSELHSGKQKRNLKSKLGLRSKPISPRSRNKICKTHQHVLRPARTCRPLPFSYSPLERELESLCKPLGVELVRAHKENSSKLPRARKYSDFVKAMCLGIHGSGAIVYRLTRQLLPALPSPTTLNHIRQNVPLSTGISKVVLDNITNQLSSMSEIDKICVVMFDEMNLDKHLDYDHIQDHILGYEDIAGNRHPHFADHALVFMVRSLMSDWKQPVAFHLGQGIHQAELENAVKETVVALQSVGLKVVAIVSDMAQPNVSALHSLAMKSLPERDNDFTIKIGDELIFVIVDPPHLLTVLRNYCLKYDVRFKGGGGQIKIAKFDILKEFLEYEKLKNVSDVYPLILTDHHLNPNSVHKMNVKLAVQLFSDKVSIYLKLFSLATGNSLANDLSEFLDIVNNLFASFNSFAPEGEEMVLRCFVTGDSKHHAFWNVWHERLTDWKFVVRSPSHKEPETKCFQFWQRNIASVQSLWRKVRDLGVSKLKTRNLNQDPLQSFFGSVRQQGDNPMNPTSRLFLNNFKIFMVKSFAANVVRKNSSISENHLSLLTGLLKSKSHSRGDFGTLETTQGVGYVSASIASFPSASVDVERHTEWIREHCNAITEGMVGFSTSLLPSFVRKHSNYLFLSSCFQCFKSVYICHHLSPSQGKVSCGSCSRLNSSLDATMNKIYFLILNKLREIGHKPRLWEELKASVRDVSLPELPCSEHRNQMKEMIFTFIIETGIRKFCDGVNSSLNDAARKGKPLK